MQSGAHATDPHGVEHFMGVFEGEETAAQFVTMGAKKYAAIDQRGELEITIAGVPKKAGSVELDAKAVLPHSGRICLFRFRQARGGS